jgi:hypothetical protein
MGYKFAQSSCGALKTLVRPSLSERAHDPFTDLSTDFVDIWKTPRRGLGLGSEVKVIPEVGGQVLLRRNKKICPKSMVETVVPDPLAYPQWPDLAGVYRPGSAPSPHTAGE